MLRNKINPFKRYLMPGYMNLYFDDQELDFDSIINTLEKRCFYRSNDDCILVSFSELFNINGHKQDLGEKFRKQIMESKDFKKLNKLYYNNKARIVEIGIEERIAPGNNSLSCEEEPYIKATIYSEGLHFDRLPTDYGRIYIALSEVKPKLGGGTLYLNRLKSMILAYLSLPLLGSKHNIKNGRISSLFKSIRKNQFSGKKGDALYFASPLVLHAGAKPVDGLSRLVLRILISL